MDQGPIESRRDVLVYTSEPFDTDTEISGPVTLKLYASTSAVDTDFTAKLAHVTPAGKSINLCESLLRLSGRNLQGEPEPATPGEIYELTLGVGQTSIVIPKGHRIRLQISSSNSPQFDRNMNTGHPIGADAEGLVAHQTVFHSPEHPSHLELPMSGVGQSGTAVSWTRGGNDYGKARASSRLDKVEAVDQPRHEADRRPNSTEAVEEFYEAHRHAGEAAWGRADPGQWG